MSKQLNITNFDQMVNTLGAYKSRETYMTYYMMFNTSNFPKLIVKWSPELEENVVVKKLIISIDKTLDETTDPSVPYVMVTLLMLDAFDDLLHNQSYLIKVTELKNILVALLNDLKEVELKNN